MNSFRNSTGIVMLAFFILISAAGCKSKKKAMEAAAAEKARMEQEASRKKQLEEEAKMKEAEEKARMEAEANAKKEAEMKAAASTPKAKLNQYFDAIAGSSSAASANSSINEALTLFASSDTPVLIVISDSGGQKDYDKPTTIRSYLNYLKDQKKNINRIENLQIDGSGKITEVELRKN
jgi:hypothetical protein